MYAHRGKRCNCSCFEIDQEMDAILIIIGIARDPRFELFRGDYRSCAMFSCWKKNGSHDMKQTDSTIIIVRNVCVLTSASMIVYLFFTRSWSAIIEPKTKLFMHVSSRNIFPTTRNLQIRVHVCRPRHCCGDWLTFGWLFCSDDCWSWPRDKKIKQSWMLR
jgi:hypothetical protein